MRSTIHGWHTEGEGSSKRELALGSILFEKRSQLRVSDFDPDTFENQWISSIGIGEIYLPRFCSLVNRLRSELSEAPFSTFEEMIFPRLLSLDVARRYGLLDSWPYILLSVGSYKDSEEPRALRGDRDCLILDPVQCAPAYGLFTNRRIPSKDLPIRIRETQGGWSYRNERQSLLRPVMKSAQFLRNEYVFIGTSAQVRMTRKDMISGFCSFLDKHDLMYRLVVGTGCFESDEAAMRDRIRAVNEPEEIPIIDVEMFLPCYQTWLEILGASLLGSKITMAFGIRCDDQDIELHSGCVGIGISRLAYSVLAQLGFGFEARRET
jgi:seryl-tRNA synthetase